jgi:hypothetical protein
MMDHLLSEETRGSDDVPPSIPVGIGGAVCRVMAPDPVDWAKLSSIVTCWSDEDFATSFDEASNSFGLRTDEGGLRAEVFDSEWKIDSMIGFAGDHAGHSVPCVECFLSPLSPPWLSTVGNRLLEKFRRT